MKNTLISIVLSLVSTLAIAEKSHKHHDHHNHSQLEVSEWAEQPQISIKMHPDDKLGWNLEVITSNFEFAPAQVNQAHQKGKGHAHLYIDGEKIGRLYGHWRHISGLTPGTHTIKVTLNSNDHQDYTVKGVIVGDKVAIFQK